MLAQLYAFLAAPLAAGLVQNLVLRLDTFSVNTVVMIVVNLADFLRVFFRIRVIGLNFRHSVSPFKVEQRKANTRCYQSLRWRRQADALLGAIVVIAFWQLFESDRASAYAAAVSPIHQSEIRATNDLVDIAIFDFAIEVDRQNTVCDGASFIESQRAGLSDGAKIYSPTRTKDGAGIAEFSAFKFGMRVLVVKIVDHL